MKKNEGDIGKDRNGSMKRRKNVQRNGGRRDEGRGRGGK
jgi:hypothetical protein